MCDHVPVDVVLKLIADAFVGKNGVNITDVLSKIADGLGKLGEVDTSPVLDTQDAILSAVDQAETGLNNLAEAVRDGMDNIGERLENGFERLADSIKKLAEAIVLLRNPEGI